MVSVCSEYTVPIRGEPGVYKCMTKAEHDQYMQPVPPPMSVLVAFIIGAVTFVWLIILIIRDHRETEKWIRHG